MHALARSSVYILAFFIMQESFGLLPVLRWQEVSYPSSRSSLGQNAIQTTRSSVSGDPRCNPVSFGQASGRLRLLELAKCPPDHVAS